MLDGQSSSKLKVSTGIDELDTVLGELYWGDNVVWEVDGAQADPFYAAIGSLAEEFDMRAFVSIGGSMPVRGTPDLTLIEAGPGTALPQPADLLREIQRLCHAPSRRLLMFDSLDQMVRAWGVGGARAFFQSLLPLPPGRRRHRLLEHERATDACRGAGHRLCGDPMHPARR